MQNRQKAHLRIIENIQMENVFVIFSSENIVFIMLYDRMNLFILQESPSSDGDGIRTVRGWQRGNCDDLSGEYYRKSKKSQESVIRAAGQEEKRWTNI